MVNELFVIHRRKPAIFAVRDLLVWSTCLRSLAFPQDLTQVEIDQGDEVYSQQEAYAFLLEIICGLHSPVVGETEVFGQFKIFSELLLQKQPELKTLVQRLFADAKSIRTASLSHLGTQSYGSWLRKEVACGPVHILGGGQLAREILPYLEKRSQVEGWGVTLHVRDPRKVDFFAGQVKSIPDLSFTGGALIVAAPMTAYEISQWLSGRECTQVFDLRDTSDSDPVQLSSVFKLSDVFSTIEITRARLMPLVNELKAECTRRSQSVTRSLVRPLGWDDICA